MDGERRAVKKTLVFFLARSQVKVYFIINITDMKSLGMSWLENKNETPNFCCLSTIPLCSLPFLPLCQSVSNFTQDAARIKAPPYGAHYSSCI